MPYQGSCLCGKVTYSLAGEFDSFYLCHCRYCQKDTGSAHAANLFASNAELVWLTGESLINTFTLPNTRHSKSFCTQCGSALPTVQLAGKLVVVPAGSLDQPVPIKPNAHLFKASAANWDADLQSIQAFDALP